MKTTVDYFGDKNPKSISFYNRIAICGEKKIVKEILENIEHATIKDKAVATIPPQVVDTIKLMIKLYPLYESDNNARLLEFAVNLISSGLLNDCPVIDVVDKKLKVIKCVLSYIEEVRDKYYSGFPDASNKTFKTYKPISELNDLYAKTVRKDTLEFKLAKGLEYNLEKMFENKIKFSESIEYKLMDNLDFSWDLECEKYNVLDIEKTHQRKFLKQIIETDMEMLSDIKYSYVEIESLCSRIIPLELCLHLSYIYDVKISLQYVNCNNDIKTFIFDSGDIFTPSDYYDKKLKREFISLYGFRTYISRNSYCFNIDNEDLNNVILRNLGYLKYDDKLIDLYRTIVGDDVLIEKSIEYKQLFKKKRKLFRKIEKEDN